MSAARVPPCVWKVGDYQCELVENDSFIELMFMLHVAHLPSRNYRYTRTHLTFELAANQEYVDLAVEGMILDMFDNDEGRCTNEEAVLHERR